MAGLMELDGQPHWACHPCPVVSALAPPPHRAGSGPAVAEANALHKGPVVFHIPQAILRGSVNAAPPLAAPSALLQRLPPCRSGGCHAALRTARHCSTGPGGSPSGPPTLRPLFRRRLSSGASGSTPPRATKPLRSWKSICSGGRQGGEGWGTCIVCVATHKQHEVGLPASAVAPHRQPQLRMSSFPTQRPTAGSLWAGSINYI